VTIPLSPGALYGVDMGTTDSTMLTRPLEWCAATTDIERAFTPRLNGGA
jgi:hypothetical protein